MRDVEENLTAAAPSLCPTTPPAYDPALNGGALARRSAVGFDIRHDRGDRHGGGSHRESDDLDHHAQRREPIRVHREPFVGVGGQKVTSRRRVLSSDISGALLALLREVHPARASAIGRDRRVTADGGRRQNGHRGSHPAITLAIANRAVANESA